MRVSVRTRRLHVALGDETVTLRIGGEGHSGIRITSRYSHASEGLLEDAADRVGDLYAFGDDQKEKKS